MYKQIITLMFLIIGMESHIYAKKIDSIDTALLNMNGIKKLDALHNFSISLSSKNPEKAKTLAQDLLRLSNEEQLKHKGLAFNDLGKAYFYMNLYDEALDNYLQAIPYFNLLNDSTLLSDNFHNIGLTYTHKGNYSKSLVYLKKSLQIDEKLKNKLSIAKNLHAIGHTNGFLKKYETQENNYKKAFILYRQLNQTKSAADISINIGDVLIWQEKNEIGYSYYKKALNLYTETNDSSRLAVTYTKLGLYKVNNNEYDSAFHFISLAKNIFTLLREKSGLIYAYSALGDLSAAQGNTKEATQLYLKCEEINNQIESLNIQKDNLQTLYKSFKKLGNQDNTLRILESYHTIKDSIYKQQQLNRSLDLESKYLHEKKQNELHSLKSRNRLYGLLFTLLVLVIISIGTFIFKHNRNKLLSKKQRLLELEQKVLRAQMNPHFIFNSLSAIQCYILNNKTLQAVDYIADFADLIRMYLQFSQNEYITINQEREILDLYINIQNKRFGDKIQYKIIIDGQLAKSKIIIPPMLAQPFIENSFEYGEICKKENGFITVKFEKRLNNIIYSIEDNGKTIYNKPPQKTENSYEFNNSSAIKITNERLNIINSKHANNKVQLFIEDRYKLNKEGSRIEFIIPIN